MSESSSPESTANESQKRVLLVAPTAKDGEITCTLLTKAGLACVLCADLAELAREIEHGAGAVLLTEDSLVSSGMEDLTNAIHDQPTWSDLPVVILMQGSAQTWAASRVLQLLGNVTLLERPAPTRSVIGALQSAIRGRDRQYLLRDQIDSIRKAEAHARELQDQLKIAIDASELGTFHCEFPWGKIVWNEHCKAHFWLPPTAKVDFDLFYSILHAEDVDRTKTAIEACINDGSLYDIEYRTVSPDGAVRWVHATGRTYYNADRVPVCFDGTTKDITAERARAEERQQLLESEQQARVEAERVSQMKDEFLATLSHELRTPLNAIFGWTQILQMGEADSETIAEGITAIDRNVRVQTKLIEDLLDMSRIISGKVRLEIQQVDLDEVVNAAIEGVKPAAQAKSIRLKSTVDPKIGDINGDPNRLQQVLWNLLTNAIKFTPGGGHVEVHAAAQESQVRISVSDSGDGISADFLPHMFERFSQADGSTRRKHGGLGLGLSIVKNLVELHGGTIEAQSDGEGHGSSFTIELPMGAETAGQVDKAKRRPTKAALRFNGEAHRLEGLKVLVVDDEPDARELVRRFLIECGARPAVAGSADEAESLVKSFAPDVIVSDVGMPERDGYDLIRELRSRGHRTPAIALTAFARAEDRIRSVQAGYQTHLTKPVEPAELVAVIAGLAGRIAARDGE